MGDSMGFRAVHAVILTGGASRRMGRPKALLPWKNGTFISFWVDTLTAHCESVTVVTGAHHDVIARAVPESARVAHATDWRRGMRASLRHGSRATPAGDLLIAHVDRPTVSPETVAMLVHDSASCPILPRYRGTLGHPIRVPQWFRPRLERMDTTPLRDLLNRMRCKPLDVNDQGVRANINTVQDYRRASIQEKR